MTTEKTPPESFYCEGGLIRKDCINCLYDKETGVLVDPCKLHIPPKNTVRKKKDISLDLPLTTNKGGV